MYAPSGQVRSSVASTKLLKPKGIPALHWTIVHSRFGNRDRSRSKSFTGSSGWHPLSPHMARGPCSDVIQTGLFDPTLKRNQLQADERSWNVQQRRKFRNDGKHPNSRKGEDVLEKCPEGSHPNTMLNEERVCRNTATEGSSQDSDRKVSLANLLLSRPTFRETLGLVAPQ